MKRFLLCLCLFTLLTACGQKPAGTFSAPETGQTEEKSVPPETKTPAETETPRETEEGWQTVTIMGEEMLWDGYRVKEPESTLDIDKMSFSDFGDAFFTEQYPVETDSYVLCKGEITEAEVLHIKGKEEGPVVYIVAGVHGDERAAWYAGRLLRNVTIRAGELYILAPANANGARNVTRYVTGQQDLNRSFPGNDKGNEAQRLAAAIYRDIEEKSPYMVFDLHEAIVYTAARDFLGSTLIFTTLDEIGDMLMEMLFATQTGDLCTTEFGFTGPGPNGSINNTVSNNLGIPVITVETFRGFEITRRVHDQLDIVQYALNYMNMR